MNVDFISSYLSHAGRSQIFFQRTQDRKGNVVRTRSQDLTVLPRLRNNLLDKLIYFAAAHIVLAAPKHSDKLPRLL